MRRVFEEIEDAEGENSAQRRRATANGIVYVTSDAGISFSCKFCLPFWWWPVSNRQG